MALNLSHRPPVFPGHMSDDGRDRDIVDLLPRDPFMMDISNTITAITGWFEDLEMDYEGYGNKKHTSPKEDYGVYAGLNLILDQALRFQSYPGNMLFDGGKFNDKPCIIQEDRDSQLGGALPHHHDGFWAVKIAEDNPSFRGGCSSAVVMDALPESSGDEGGSPHEALLFPLTYLGLKDLLSVERVCRPLHSMVRTDPFLWRNIHIDKPLNDKITDDILINLSSRAQGNLQCLSLVECPRITDNGLKHVLDTNPKLTKLCVPGCTRLSIEGIVNILKDFKYSKGTSGIQHLRIGGLYGITPDLFEELKFLLGTSGQVQFSGHKPHFYRRGNFYMLCDDERAIDIEICPRCQKSRLVYDCTAESCKSKVNATERCRACTLCIPRCSYCGRCINDEYEETFCLELMCSDCSKQVSVCHEMPNRQNGLMENVAHPELDHNICLHG